MKTAEIIDELKSMVNNYVVLNGQYVIPKSVLDIYIEHLETAEQTQPVSSKLHLPNLEIENKGNQTYGEFMRSNPKVPTPSVKEEVKTTDFEKESE